MQPRLYCPNSWSCIAWAYIMFLLFFSASLDLPYNSHSVFATCRIRNARPIAAIGHAPNWSLKFYGSILWDSDIIHHFYTATFYLLMTNAQFHVRKQVHVRSIPYIHIILCIIIVYKCNYRPILWTGAFFRSLDMYELIFYYGLLGVLYAERPLCFATVSCYTLPFLTLCSVKLYPLQSCE